LGAACTNHKFAAPGTCDQSGPSIAGVNSGYPLLEEGAVDLAPWQETNMGGGVRALGRVGKSLPQQKKSERTPVPEVH
jgi:hypothetical protein